MLVMKKRSIGDQREFKAEHKKERKDKEERKQRHRKEINTSKRNRRG